MQRGQLATKVLLSSRQAVLLERHRNKAKVSVQQRGRIDIVLSAFAGKNNTAICKQLSMARSTVVAWRNRWASGYQGLCTFEAGSSGEGVSDKQLLARMLDHLSDSPRSGAPKRISLSEEQQIVALACRKPEDYDIPVTQWNREMLAKVAMAEGIVEKISPRYVSELLKKTS